MPNQTTDRWSFLVNFIKHPLRNASVAPSSRIAARNMLCGLDLEHLEYVVELGPGTAASQGNCIIGCLRNARCSSLSSRPGMWAD